MTSIRFGQQAAGESTVTRLGAQAAERFFTMPDRIQQATDTFVARKAGGSATDKIAAATVKKLGKLGQMITSYDFHEFPEVVLGKLKFKVSEPPIGAMMLLLYPFTMGPRLLRAYERGQKNNDYREVGDVLRRDGIAITIFLFLLKPLLTRMNKLKQKFDGLTVVDPKAGSLLTYSQFANYKLDSEKALLAILREGNGKGLLRAVKALNDRGLAKLGENQLSGHVTRLQELVPQLVDAFDKKQPNVQKLAKEVIKEIRAAEAVTAQVEKIARAGGSGKLAQSAGALKGEFEGFVTKYAKTRRLPVDVLGFAIVVGAIGWFPVWFNSLWNKKKFEEEQMKARAATAGQFNAGMAYQALRQSSRLANNFARPM